MKKKLIGLLLTGMLVLASSVNAYAIISSTSELAYKADLLNQYSSMDLMSFINKSDLIGFRLQNYEMLTSQYQNQAKQAEENLRSIEKEIEVIQITSEIAETEKMMQINRLYQEADAILYDLDSKTTQYVYAIRRFMPTITYDRYVKKLMEYYSNLHLTDTDFTRK